MCTLLRLNWAKADNGDNEAKLMTKLAPEWVRTSDSVIRSPARYHWTTALANIHVQLVLFWMPMLAHHCRQHWAKIGPILNQHWPYIQLDWAMLGFPYWANIVPMQWPYIGPMSKLHWAYVGCQCWPIIATNIGPILACLMGLTFHYHFGPI